MGKIITLQKNDEIVKINVLFDYYKKLNSELNGQLKCRLKQSYLLKAYNLLFETDLDKAVMTIINGAIEQVQEIYERRISPDYNEMNRLVQKFNNIYTHEKQKLISKYEKLAQQSENKFRYFFNSCARPIVGIYCKNHSFEILNSDQMYKNGEESLNQIRLKKITMGNILYYFR